MSAAFVFMHVGPQPELATLFVRSIRALHPDADVIQCADLVTPAIAGANHVRRFAGDIANLMKFRLECWAALDWPAPAFYLDTDMLCVSVLDPAKELEGCDVAVCSRSYDRNAFLNTRFGDMDLSEYAGKTLGEVYPYVGCATVTNGGTFWSACLDHMRTLDPKFHFWYGDQEALRDIVRTGRFTVKPLPESVYARLPDAPPMGEAIAPRLIHFKGQRRKPMMLEFARRLRINA